MSFVLNNNQYNNSAMCVKIVELTENISLLLIFANAFRNFLLCLFVGSSIKIQSIELNINFFSCFTWDNVT